MALTRTRKSRVTLQTSLNRPIEGAQHNYAEFSAAERRHKGAGRAPLAIEAREAGWRLLDPARDNVEEPQHSVDYGDSYPLNDTTVLYYWRTTYWRRLAS